VVGVKAILDAKQRFFMTGDYTCDMSALDIELPEMKNFVMSACILSFYDPFIEVRYK
jgi:hypothetical protein